MRTIGDLTDTERRVLAALKQQVAAELPGLDVRLVLFGSRARGDAEPDSDMDVLVEVDTERLAFADKQRLRRIASRISIDSGIVLSLLVVDRHVVQERGDFSVFETIREEGIPV